MAINEILEQARLAIEWQLSNPNAECHTTREFEALRDSYTAIERFQHEHRRQTAKIQKRSDCDCPRAREAEKRLKHVLDTLEATIHQLSYQVKHDIDI